jgi:UDP-N-acetylmuramate dehydrogenase
MTPRSDVALASFTTMDVGGPARWFVEARTESDVCDALGWASERSADVHILGGGSNIVIADAGFDGLVIKVGVNAAEPGGRGRATVFDVGAGTQWDEFVARTVAENCAGVECLSGIPGLIGGTPVQNVGAYGQDVSQTITRVRVVDRRTRQGAWVSNAECAFGYRTSRFKREDRERYVVTRVEFGLRPDAPPTIAYADVIAYFERTGRLHPSLSDVRAAVMDIRRRKGMVIEDGNAANRSCGSFFVNPVAAFDRLRRIERQFPEVAVPHYVVDAGTVKIPAAWLIERAGFAKGFTRGPVGISPFQAQAIVNLGGAHAADVLALALDVKRAVWNMFGITIVPEPVFVGFASTPELRELLTPQRSH